MLTALTMYLTDKYPQDSKSTIDRIAHISLIILSLLEDIGLIHWLFK